MAVTDPVCWAGIGLIVAGKGLQASSARMGFMVISKNANFFVAAKI